MPPALPVELLRAPPALPVHRTEVRAGLAAGHEVLRPPQQPFDRFPGRQQRGEQTAVVRIRFAHAIPFVRCARHPVCPAAVAVTGRCVVRRTVVAVKIVAVAATAASSASPAA